MQQLLETKNNYEEQYRDFIIDKDANIAGTTIKTRIEAGQQDIYLCRQRIDDARVRRLI